MPRPGSPRSAAAANIASSTARAALRLAAAFASTLALIPVAAAAQAHQCSIPARVTVPNVTRDGPVRRMPVTGYTLALSWSPEFCRFRAEEQRHARQCSGRAGRFGLVVHGLWPEGARGWPQWCAARREPAPVALRANLCLSPSAALLARQWAKHGSCMTRSPATYFRVTRILYRGLRLPDLDRLSREDGLDAGLVRTRFADANRGWHADAVGLVLDERGWLEELRLCYDRRFMPADCSPRRFGPDDAAPVRIWRGL